MADTGISTQAAARRPANNTQRAQSLLQLARTPVARQLLLLVGIAAAVALGLAIVLWSRGPNMSLLYANLAPKDAANIVQTLQANQTPYKLGSNGTSIFVPAAKVDALRLHLAAQGLPQGSASSQAASSSDSAFGMSDTQEANRDRELLEQNLERSIASLQSIRSAHVQLALPKPSAFIRDDDQPSASVLVELYPGRQLSQAQVAAIVHLVAASVPNLDPSRVSVVDQQGELLTANDASSAATAIDNQRMSVTTRMENAYAQRVQSILAPLVGANHVHAEVHLDLDFKDTRLASEVYGKGKEALRSEQTSSTTHTDGDTASGGVPGALSNQPPVTTQQPTAANPNTGTASVASASSSGTSKPTDTSNQATRNYEVDRTISYTNNPAGDIQRMSVAVLVDNKQVQGKDGKTESVPLGKAELAHLTELVQSAVGFDAKRGDVVSVVNEPFRLPSETGSSQKPPFWEAPGVMDLIKQGLGVLAVLLLAFGLGRPMLRGLLKQDKPQQEPTQSLPGPQTSSTARVTINETVADRDSDNRALPGRGTAMSYEQKTGLAKRVASENPRQVAQIVKNWVAADGA